MLFIYKCLTNILFPIIIIVIFIRRIFSKEDADRFKEKLFVSSFKIEKKFKKLIWIHAASLGEVKSVVPLILKLNKKNNYKFLITSVSVSSANFVAKEFKGEKNITHRFFPFDKLNLVKSFLDGWSPDLVIFVDSEIWPNFIFEVKIRKIPLVLLNGRITKKTYKRWMKIPNFARNIFNNFDLCLASNRETLSFLKVLNVKRLKFIGNLKLAGSFNSKKLINNKYEKYLRSKRFWCAASTHDGEEAICLKVHKNLKIKYPGLLTIIIPRHINRCREIQKLCIVSNLQSQILNNKDSIKPTSEILIINSFGQLEKYFKISKSIFMGKSLLANLKLDGGQNPIEAAVHGCKIYHGPFVYNFKEIYQLLKKYKISQKINNDTQLTSKLMIDLKLPGRKRYKSTKKIQKLGEGILFKSTNEIRKIFVK